MFMFIFRLLFYTKHDQKNHFIFCSVRNTFYFPYFYGQPIETETNGFSQKRYATWFLDLYRGYQQ
jgi:hypothetical protein